MGYIFISYSRRQLYFAESVALTLQSSGLEVWFDLQKLAPGVNWESTLEEGYGNCEKLVLIASNAAIQSSFVKAEWESALQNGREIILVLAEAVELPEALKGCPVYDARNRFDQTIQSLISYLCGENSARHDPVPAPGRFPYPLKMPSAIWLTLITMMLPTITAWIAVLCILPFLDNSSYAPDWLTRVLPRDLNPVEFTFLFIGIFYGFNLAQVKFPLLPFWRHEAGRKTVEDRRWKLLWYPLVASLIAVIVSSIDGSWNGFRPPLSYLMFIFPLVTAYWSYRVWGRSPDILRWMPSGEADQEMREQIEAELEHIQPQPVAQAEQNPRPAAATFTLHFHPADQYNARRITSILKANGCQAAGESQADYHVILVSNRTSRQWLLEQNQTLPGRIIHILCTNINTPPELQPLLQNQWVDFRNGRVKTLRAFAAYLNRTDDAEVAYGMQVSPTGFDTGSSFPPSVQLIAGCIAAISLLFVLAGAVSMGEFKWYLTLLGLPWVFYAEEVITRKRPLPTRLHKFLGNRLAWFAHPAPAAADAIGNQDSKYTASLFKPFWKED